MTDDDLGRELRRAAAGDGSRPDAAGLWQAGRSRRRRTTTLRVAAAVVAVLAVVGTVVVATRPGDSSQDVRASDSGIRSADELGTRARPSPEPMDLPVAMEITDAPLRDDGSSEVAAGEPFSVRFTAADSTGPMYSRGLLSWERWAGGSAWEPTHTIQPWPDGTVSVLTNEEFATISARAEPRGGDGTDPAAAPEDSEPGWYRVCAEMAREDSSGQVTIRPCVQVRVRAAQHTTTDTQPDRVPIGIEVRTGGDEIDRPGEQIAVTITPEPRLRSHEVVSCPSWQARTEDGGWDPHKPGASPIADCAWDTAASFSVWDIPPSVPAGEVQLCVQVRSLREPGDVSWVCTIVVVRR